MKAFNNLMLTGKQIFKPRQHILLWLNFSVLELKRYSKQLSRKAKIGAALVTAAEPLEKIVGKAKKATTWSKIHNTKANRRRPK
ncbi:MAG: hypothetical protein QT03_C0001G0615 [archaeon GW2011_AR10]|uniref:Uncharacterized protein n=1 Tax=Candidatus Iainarchaeum sp. TaxID=3101447 RepID=A0A7J4ISG5_9ARCH|nr:MAG: hypothetical protein QT03_C0001G0615 [archaeon GW2011_AR10]HIH07770.1 hypothetical protein [Candidatus Diapherotrites archaeon]